MHDYLYITHAVPKWFRVKFYIVSANSASISLRKQCNNISYFVNDKVTDIPHKSYWCNKRTVLRKQCWNTNRNIKRLAYCQYGSILSFDMFLNSQMHFRTLLYKLHNNAKIRRFWVVRQKFLRFWTLFTENTWQRKDSPLNKMQISFWWSHHRSLRA